MMGWAGELGSTRWTLMALCMLVFWGVAFYLMSSIFRTNRTSRPNGTEDEADPVQISERRFARGEISYEELVAHRQVLTGPQPGRGQRSIEIDPERGRMQS